MTVSDRKLSRRVLALLIAAALGTACDRPSVVAAVVDAGDGDDGEELAVIMGEAQRHSAKLGYALERGNGPLSAFYLDETIEVLEEIKEVQAEDEMPIGQPASIIMDPLVSNLRAAIESENWTLSWSRYEDLIEGCNRCHAATEHEFIKILPAQGSPPYNQQF